MPVQIVRGMRSSTRPLSGTDAVRVAAANSIARLHEGRDNRSLILVRLWRVALDTASEARVSAIEALGLKTYHDARSVPLLVAALRNQSAATRAAAALSLGELGPLAKPAVEALHQALRDSSETVRH